MREALKEHGKPSTAAPGKWCGDEQPRKETAVEESAEEQFS